MVLTVLSYDKMIFKLQKKKYKGLVLIYYIKIFTIYLNKNIWCTLWYTLKPNWFQSTSRTIIDNLILPMVCYIIRRVLRCRSFQSVEPTPNHIVLNFMQITILAMLHSGFKPGGTLMRSNTTGLWPLFQIVNTNCIQWKFSI